MNSEWHSIAKWLAKCNGIYSLWTQNVKTQQQQNQKANTQILVTTGNRTRDLGTAFWFFTSRAQRQLSVSNVVILKQWIACTLIWKTAKYILFYIIMFEIQTNKSKKMLTNKNAYFWFLWDKNHQSGVIINYSAIKYCQTNMLIMQIVGLSWTDWR